MAGARGTVERVRAKIAHHTFRDLAIGESPSFCAGIAAYPHPSALSTEDMFALAESALLDAKGQVTGRIGAAA